jgi:hypothetical protein
MELCLELNVTTKLVDQKSCTIQFFRCLINKARVGVTVVIEALCYKPEGYGFETR